MNYESNKIYSDSGGGRSVVVRVLQEEGRGSASQRGEIAAGSGNGKVVAFCGSVRATMTDGEKKAVYEDCYLKTPIADRLR